MSQDATPDDKTKLIRDIPSETDSFKIHTKIADAIVDLVKRERGGISVGISGSWGSGKSTIINFIQKKFKEDPECHLWLFDTWEHEGDHLRRMFLESMQDSLQKAGWITDKEWRDELDYLAKRRKQSKQHDKPRISMFLVVLAVATLAIPIGNALLTNALSQKQIYYTVHWKAWVWDIRVIIPILLIFAPALLLLWLPIRYYIIPPDEHETQPKSFKEFAASYFTWFLQRSATEVERVVMQDPDPTSIEFASTFKVMMAAALKLPQRRLVIVIDNLDRISRDQAKGIWSTLQTFLQVSSGGNDWHDRFFVVIPYDHSGISRIWGGEEGEKQEIVESFLNKSLQIRFHVPITADVGWKDYLMGKEGPRDGKDGGPGILQEALPGHSAEDFRKIYRLYDVMRVRGSLRGAPTPRELILYVNQIGALHRVWGDKIPISDLAYFTLLQSQGENIQQGLLNGKIPADRVKPYLSDHAQEHLAALHFGVDIEHAQILLLRGSIREALDSDDRSISSLWLNREPASFWAVFEKVIEDIEAEPRIAAVKEIARAAANLSVLDQAVFAAENPGYVNRQLDVLRNRMNTVLDLLKVEPFAWNPPSEFEMDGFMRLATRHNDHRMVDSFIRLYAHTPLWEDNGAPILQRVTGYVQSLIMLYGELEKASLLDADRAAIVPGGVQVYVSVANVLRAQDQDGRYWGLFKLGEFFLNENSGLLGDVKAMRYTDQHVAMLPVLWAADPSFDLLPVFRAMLQVIERERGQEETGEQTVGAVTAMLESMFEFMTLTYPGVEEIVNQIAELDIRTYLFDLSMETGSLELAAIVIVILMRLAPERLDYNPEASSILRKLLDDPADALVKRVVELLGSNDAYEKTLKAAPSTENFVNACLEVLKSSGDEQ